MRRLIALTALALALGAPVQAAEGDVKQVLAEAGLLGAWAADCSAPPGNENGWETIALDEAGEAYTLEDHAAWSSRYAIVEARRIDGRDTWVKLVHSQGDVFVSVYRRDGDRQKTWTSTNPEGEVVVRDGHFTEDGTENTWFNRCSPR